MGLLFIILFIIFIQLLIYSLLKIIYGYHYDYGTYQMKYNNNDIINIDKYYRNNRIININKKKKNKYVKIIAFNIPSRMFQFFSYYYYWLSNDYENSTIINHREYKNNNEYFYMMKYNNNVTIQSEILKTTNYRLIDKKYNKEIRDDWEEDIWYYIHNRLYQNSKRGKIEINFNDYDDDDDDDDDIKGEVTKKSKTFLDEDIRTRQYIRDKLIPDIDIDEYHMIGKIYVKDIYMFICNYQKYVQNMYLKYLLVNTTDNLLLYHTSQEDKYWGTGEWDQSIDFLNSIPLIEWKYDNVKTGNNILGQIIMLIREIIKDNTNRLMKPDTDFMVYCDFFIEMCKKYNYHIFKNM